MHLYHFDKDPKFGRGLVWAGPEESRAPDKVEVKSDQGKATLEFKHLKNVDDATDDISRQERDILEGIDSFNNNANDRVRNFVTVGKWKDLGLTKAVHEYHEDKAAGLIDKETDYAAAKITRLRKGWVRFWGAPESALATGKLRELNVTKETLDTAITEESDRAKKYEALLDQFRSSKTGLFSKRLGMLARRKLLKKEPGKVKEMKKAKKKVTEIAGQTRDHLRAYDSRLKEKYRSYVQDEKKFKSYVMAFPALANNEELATHLDKYIAADQRDESGRRNPDKGKFLKKIKASTLTNEEKEVMEELYEKLLTKKDRKMRELLDARSLEEEVKDVKPDLLRKLNEGQSLSLTYNRYSYVDDAKGDYRNPSKVTQDAYVKKSGNEVVLRVRKASVESEGTITREAREKHSSGAIGLATHSYKPTERTITINTTTGHITHQVLAKDEKGNPVQFTERRDKALKDMKISGKISKRTLNS